MIAHIALLLAFQLGGETLSRGLGLPVPGPVLGLVGFFALLVARPALADRMRPACSGLLSHLSLLFVPAGVGVTAQLGVFGADGPALVTALVLSTILAILAGVGTFLAVARLTGRTDADG
ncbi:CidA/LrgA family protein [Roseivivax isoporae]|uniref:Murein hydrolase transporter LrgA n=1 Tax=Roseivivax isoporae LMG 25204 TaxID=1449351 RepID=X7F9N7_9RHOB|nr:CidA/LrgA family protein [Roseivivax isoporae]ETX29592.1 murein hydrolase transporter LrgA [Roseivivax isoporae LMG 25204]